MIKKVFSPEIKQIGEEDDRVLRFVTSTEDIDRAGDIVSVDGWDLEQYKKNPVILYGHDYRSLPVGKTVDIYVDPVKKVMVQDIEFIPKEISEFADTVYKMAKAGYLNATSVGFVGTEYEKRKDEKGNFLGIKFTKQTLLETSIVPVPCNGNALIEERNKWLEGVEMDLKLELMKEDIDNAIDESIEKELKSEDGKIFVELSVDIETVKSKLEEILAQKIADLALEQKDSSQEAESIDDPLESLDREDVRKLFTEMLSESEV